MLRTIAFVGVVALLVLGVASAAFAGTITQTPNFNGATWAASSAHVISWSSTGLIAGETLELHLACDQDTSDIVIASGLPQNGTYTVTVPTTVGNTYCYYLVSSGSPQTYSDANNEAWSFAVGPAPVNTPASSPWSLALMGFAGLMVAAASLSMQRRTARSRA